MRQCGWQTSNMQRLAERPETQLRPRGAGNAAILQASGSQQQQQQQSTG